MRDKLIHKIMSLNKPTISLQTAMDIVDAIIDEGVIVPPCKVGDTLYDIYESLSNGETDIQEIEVKVINVRIDARNKPCLIIGNKYIAFDEIGKTVFLTEEEAEKELKRRSEEG